jgi:N-lysine methyltransferase SETD6
MSEYFPNLILHFRELRFSQNSTFVLECDLELPDALLSFVRLLVLPQDEWVKAKSKGQLPKPKMDPIVLGIVCEVLEKKLQSYPTEMQVRKF